MKRIDRKKHQKRVRIEMASTSAATSTDSEIFSGISDMVNTASNRGEYAKISDVDRERLINCFEENGDWIDLTKKINIKVQTARSIIMTFKKEGRRKQLGRGGNRPKSLSSEQVETLIRIIEEKPTVTLKEMIGELSNIYPTWIPCSPQTVSRVLDGSFISLKLLREIPFE